MKKLYIYGASFGDVIKLIDAINRVTPTWMVVGFLDDTPELKEKTYMGYNIPGGRELLPDLVKQEDVYFFPNVNGTRSASQKITGLLDSYHCEIPALIHPTIDLNYVEIGRGVYHPGWLCGWRQC